MDGLHLRAVSRTQGNNRALKAGEVTPAGYVLDFEEVPVLVQAFRRMVRTLEFDVCEMAVTTYLTAKAHGVAFTAHPGLPGPRLPPRRDGPPGATGPSCGRRTWPAGGSGSTAATRSPPASGPGRSCATSTASTSTR